MELKYGIIQSKAAPVVAAAAAADQSIVPYSGRAGKQVSTHFAPHAATLPAHAPFNLAQFIACRPTVRYIPSYVHLQLPRMLSACMAPPT